MRVSRLLTLVGLLKARGSMTADELAGELGVSRRTVCREEDGDLRAEPLNEPTTLDPLPRRHPGTAGFDALATWEQLQAIALR
jgi:HTH domain